MIKKKLLTILMVLCMVTVLIPTQAFAKTPAAGTICQPGQTMDFAASADGYIMYFGVNVGEFLGHKQIDITAGGQYEILSWDAVRGLADDPLKFTTPPGKRFAGWELRENNSSPKWEQAFLYAVFEDVEGGDDSGVDSGANSGESSEPVVRLVDEKTGGSAATAAVQRALDGGNATATLNDYTGITAEGLDAIAKAAGDKPLMLQLNEGSGSYLRSRTLVDGVALAKSAATAELTEVGFGLLYHQKWDNPVYGVNEFFERYFDNTVRSIAFTEPHCLGVSAKISCKVDLTGLNTQTLYFYSYNRDTNLYRRIDNPSYSVDEAGYTHLTVPFGGSVIITDKPLTLRK